MDHSQRQHHPTDLSEQNPDHGHQGERRNPAQLAAVLVHRYRGVVREHRSTGDYGLEPIPIRTLADTRDQMLAFQVTMLRTDRDQNGRGLAIVSQQQIPVKFGFQQLRFDFLARAAMLTDLRKKRCGVQRSERPSHVGQTGNSFHAQRLEATEGLRKLVQVHQTVRSQQLRIGVCHHNRSAPPNSLRPS